MSDVLSPVSAEVDELFRRADFAGVLDELSLDMASAESESAARPRIARGLSGSVETAAKVYAEALFQASPDMDADEVEHHLNVLNKALSSVEVCDFGSVLTWLSVRVELGSLASVRADLESYLALYRTDHDTETKKRECESLLRLYVMRVLPRLDRLDDAYEYLNKRFKGVIDERVAEIKAELERLAEGDADKNAAELADDPASSTSASQTAGAWANEFNNSPNDAPLPDAAPGDAPTPLPDDAPTPLPDDAHNSSIDKEEEDQQLKLLVVAVCSSVLAMSIIYRRSFSGLADALFAE